MLSIHFELKDYFEVITKMIVRNCLGRTSGGKNPKSSYLLFRYYDQLHAIEYKLPITENQIRIYFKWQDAFVSGGSLFGSKQKTNGSWKLAYEKASALFNIGHAYSELALAQNLSLDEQMKAASRYFQLASGVFSYLKDYVNANSLSDLSVDFEPAVLASISWLMLAQAAELIYLKSASLKGERQEISCEDIRVFI